VTASPIPAKQGIDSRVLSILSYLILLGGIVTIGFAAYLVIVSYSSLPYWDGWTQVKYAAQGNPSTLDWLWKQHNEHRMPIPKLFLLADLRWFHARQVFLLASIFIIQSLQLWLLAWSMRVLGGWRGALCRTGVGLAAFCVFCPSQWENLTWGFQVCFVLPGLCATTSFVGLLLYWKRSGEGPSSTASHGKYLLVPLAAALGATWSLVNGNLLWPLLLVSALLLRLRLAALSYAIAGALSTAVYLHGYARPWYAMNSTEAPANMLKYLAAYFGSSWVGSSFHLAEIIGADGLAVFLIVVLRLPTYIRNGNALDIQLALMLVFSFGTGLLTAFGRSGFGINQAFTSRYQTVSLLFWCCLGLLLLGAVSTLPRSSLFISAQVVLLTIMVVGVRHANIPLIRARVRAFRLNAAAMSLVTNVPDAEQLRWASDDPGALFTMTPYMHQERLSVFAEPKSWMLGEPLESAFSVVSPNECTGAIVSSVAMGGAAPGPAPVRITGWAWDYRDRRPPSSIVAVTGGIIIGEGAVGDWRPLDQFTRAGMTNYIGYTGFVHGGISPGPVEIYAILPGKSESACLIATLK
jgi:hypothetical protein